MTLEEYNAREEALCDELRNEWSTETFEKLLNMQYIYMTQVLNDYAKTINGDPAKQVCYDLLDYAVYHSESGNAIVEADFVTNKEEAQKLQNTIFAEIGDYLLDDCQVYKDSYGDWVADVMFGGAYIPEWDGWIEYING